MGEGWVQLGSRCGSVAIGNYRDLFFLNGLLYVPCAAVLDLIPVDVFHGALKCCCPSELVFSGSNLHIPCL